jgi:hypothetical protein
VRKTGVVATIRVRGRCIGGGGGMVGGCWEEDILQFFFGSFLSVVVDRYLKKEGKEEEE